MNEPDPRNPGWSTWNLSERDRFNDHAVGALVVRREGERSARLRLAAARRHTNLNGALHGGLLLTLADLSLFATAQLVLGNHVSGSATIDLSCQFIAAGKEGLAVDAVAEVLKETGRLVFLRGVIEQGGDPIASFSGTIRKSPRK